jgi:putative ABC transport system permease protein
MSRPLKEKPKRMRLIDILDETYSAVTVNKVRSGLTVLGIVIGIGSVIAMVAIGNGAKGSIESSIQSIGSNLITVSPGMQRGVGQQVSSGRGSAQTLTQADAEAIITDVAGVRAVSPELSRRYQITAKGTNTNTQVIGATPDYTVVRNVETDIGLFLSAENITAASKVAVLGPTTRDDLFGEGADPTGQNIKINKIEFKIIGVTKTKGGTGFNNQDDVVYVPISTAQRYLAGDAYVTSVAVSAQDAQLMSSVQQQITDLLLARHKISDPTLADFNVINQADILAAASSVTGVFTTLLAAIAGISLLVGGIGIMNMMLTTVTERTREIGLRKAIGGKNRDITLQFLAEAIMQTLIGGIFGTILGWLIAWLITKFAGINTTVSWSSVVLAFGVSAAIGLIFGYYPAQRAARLNPIEALRYE